jgi:hypothetical protein
MEDEERKQKNVILWYFLTRVSNRFSVHFCEHPNSFWIPVYIGIYVEPHHGPLTEQIFISSDQMLVDRNSELWFFFFNMLFLIYGSTIIFSWNPFDEWTGFFLFTVVWYI